MNALTQSEGEHGRAPTSRRIGEWMETGGTLRQPCSSGERARRGRTPDEEVRARRRAASHMETKQACELDGDACKLLGIPLKTSRMTTVDDCVGDKHVCCRRRGKECDRGELSFVMYMYVLTTGRKYLDLAPIDQLCMLK